MNIGVLIITLHLSAIGSLKAKRSIVKSVIGRLHSRFHCSAAEIDAQDNKLIARIGITLTANDGRYVNSQLDRIVGFIQQDGRYYLGQVHRELFTVCDE